MIWLYKFKNINYSHSNLKNKKTNKVKKLKNLELFQFFYLILIFFSLIQLGLNIYLNKKEYYSFNIQSHINQITIKINGTGEQCILGSDYSFCPDSI